jgi:FtsZ-binding cell division protein ZapB
MDTLNVLGKKINSLVEFIAKLKVENTKLAEDNAQLKVKLKELEKSIDADNKRAEKLDKERVNAKVAIDDLIESIDSLIGKEHQSR